MVPHQETRPFVPPNPPPPHSPRGILQTNFTLKYALFLTIMHNYACFNCTKGLLYEGVTTAIHAYHFIYEGPVDMQI